MAVSNRDRVSKALEVLREPLLNYVETQLQSHLGKNWADEVSSRLKTRLDSDRNGGYKWDNYALLRTIDVFWNDVFTHSLDRTHRSWVFEIIDVRNKYAHDHPFSSDETRRGLDTIGLFLEAISASEYAQAIKKIQYDLLRTVFSEESRSKTRAVAKVEGQPLAGLKSWRDVVTPHKDVQSGNYQQAEFAADLSEVVKGRASIEYQDPQEFFKRTHLTEGLKELLEFSFKRICLGQGEPAIQLQTNFGGGKTHSLISLYHIFQNPKSALSYTGIEDIAKELSITELPEKVNIAVFVGTSLGVNQPSIKEDGTAVHTVWGEIAWQLGGKEGYSLLESSDISKTSPGDEILKTLFEKYSPCLVVIDEWIAHIRNAYMTTFFEANLTFAQELSQAIRACPKAFLVASLPSSAKIEIGGEGGQIALDSLKNTFIRLARPWKPASSTESYEIIRRRLFEPLTGEQHAFRDGVISAFIKLYKDNANDFPTECKEFSYKQKLESCYPIHPELFERLYSDWSTLEKFQQTRGVLRLMASVIHSLWEQGDKSLLIMPSSIPIDDRTVCDSLTYYLSDGWKAVIDKDVDGPNSLPLEIDRNNDMLGRLSACRRVSRAIFMGSAPIEQGSNPGLIDKKINLGCVQPGESVATFGDTAIRRLEERATYLYQESRRYWYSTQPSVDQLARERATLIDPDALTTEIIKQLKVEADGRKRMDFVGGLHVFNPPYTQEEIPDEKEVRLVILGPEYPLIKNAEESPARKVCQQILEKRGNSPRLCKNMLVFLAPDQTKLADLEDAVRQFLAWHSICKDTGLDLKPSEKQYVDNKREEAESIVKLRIAETWIWCVYPYQTPETINRIDWEEIKIQAQQDGLAGKVCKKLRDEEHLMVTYGADRLKLDLERFNLWQGKNHIEVRQLWEFYATYPYLPRLKDQQCLFKAIEGVYDGHFLSDRFAYATGYDESKEKYIGLVAEPGRHFTVSLNGLLVQSEVAEAQIARERERVMEPVGAPASPTATTRNPVVSAPEPHPNDPVQPEPIVVSKAPKRFYASVDLDETRIGRDAGRIAEEVVQHLADLPGATVEVTMEIQVRMPDGASEQVVRTVTENCKTLKFKSHGFEQD